MAAIKQNKTVVLGFSGGVDSTAACLLLQDRGYTVQGLYFDVTPEGNAESRRNAQKRAAELGISLYCVNVSKQFQEAVIDDFCRAYKEGRTPNPCVLCNPLIKFKTLIDYAEETGASYIATGHYARVEQVPGREEWAVYAARCREKDQSYMLYRLQQPVLKRLLLPLGQAENKEWVRRCVEQNGIGNFAQKDSQDICFLPENCTYADFLEQQGIQTGPGTFCDREGNELAPSKGYLHYTIGQRKGFGVGFGRPLFVTGIDAEQNRVILGEEPELMTSVVSAGDAVLTAAEHLPTEKSFGKPTDSATASDLFPYSAKIRYRAKPASCQVILNEETSILTIRFQTPQRAATPGQSVVLYDGDRVIGGGILK